MSLLIEKSIKWWHFEHVFVKMGFLWTHWCRHMAEGRLCWISSGGWQQRVSAITQIPK